MSERLLFIITSLSVFLADRLTKVLAYQNLKHPIDLVPGMLSLRIAENRGAAFSIFSTGNDVLRKVFLILIPVLICLYIVYYVFKKSVGPKTAVSLGLILGGALGNLYDRLVSGKVIDFIDFHFKTYHYPTFNVADVSVFLGTLILIVTWRKS